MEKELEEMLCGSKLGFGIHRTVYEYNPDPTCVIKVATQDDGRQANLIEAYVWEQIAEAKSIAKWFAPVVMVSPAGKYLVMKKAEFGLPKDYPKKLPHFFTDVKYDNYGFIKGHLVCVDYARVILHGLTLKMKPARWWKY